MPAALCSYCLGETRIGGDYQMGNVRKMKWETASEAKTGAASARQEDLS